MKNFSRERVVVLHKQAYGSPIVGQELLLVQYHTGNHNLVVSIVAMVFSLILVYVNVMKVRSFFLASSTRVVSERLITSSVWNII